MDARDSANPNPARTVVIGTAGHIDHGKTALIRALTGVDTDRLPEEKRRGITIDLGFASMDLDGDEPARVSFIDVPGHARFVRNMLAGAGSIDAVLLVISAEEGVKPQTEEHLAICALLGIERGLTVVTKIDAVEADRLDSAVASIRDFLSTTFLASEPMVLTSALTGVGFDALRRELGALAARIPPRNSDSVTRLPLDRAFTMKGFGTVVTGTLISGSVALGEELTVEPGGRVTKVRGLQWHGHAATEAHAATRVALNLTRMETADFHRGDTLVSPSTISAVETVDVEIGLLGNAPPLKHRARVHFHAFASECMAAVSLYGYRPIDPNTSGLARLRLSKPIVVLPGDRFVLRQGSPLLTVGGGRVLDAHPVQRQKRAQSCEWLQLIRAAAPEEQLALRVARRSTAGINVAGLSAETGVKPQVIRRMLAPLTESGRIVSIGADGMLSREAVNDAVTTAEREFEKLAKEAGSAGVKRSVLKGQTGLSDDVFDYALRQLAQLGRLRTAGELLLAATGEGAVTSRDQERLAAILNAYEQAGLAAPSVADLTAKLELSPAEMRRLITALLREKKLVRLGDDSLFMHPNALAGLKRQVQSRQGQTMDVAQFKELTGLSRKYAIPLLEYLDRERVTRKLGDGRLVL